MSLRPIEAILADPMPIVGVDCHIKEVRFTGYITKEYNIKSSYLRHMNSNGCYLRKNSNACYLKKK